MRGAVISKAEAENDKIIWRSSEKEKINTSKNKGKKILGHMKTWHWVHEIKTTAAYNGKSLSDLSEALWNALHSTSSSIVSVILHHRIFPPIYHERTAISRAVERWQK
jgi:hypothetical protein